MNAIYDIHTHKHFTQEAIINASLNDMPLNKDFYYSIGLHPWNLNIYNIEDTLKNIESLASSADNIIAIGECGLDSNINIPLEIQLYVFERHILLSEKLKKPLIIHCVKRSDDILRLHKKYNPNMPWIFHGFRSNINVLKNIIKHDNIYISIGEKFNAETILNIPDEKILIETDESELTIEYISKKVAEARKQSHESFLEIINKNTSIIFKNT